MMLIFQIIPNFSDKLMQAVDAIAPYREFRVKGHTVWFDGEIMERIENRDKLLKKKIKKNWSKSTTKSIVKLNSWYLL